MSFLLAISDYINTNIISCIFVVIVFVVLVIYIRTPKTIEGFAERAIQSEVNNPFYACPVIKHNININENLIEHFTQNNAVQSLKDLKDVIKAFTERYAELECDTTIFKTITPEISPTS